jgi:ketosteroid isomerase-like protein
MNIGAARAVNRAMSSHRHTATTQRRSAHPRRDPHAGARGGLRGSVEIARRCFAAFNHTVADGADDYYELLDAEVDWRPITALLDGRSYRGRDDVRGWVDDMKGDWRAFEIRWTELRDLGRGRVLAFGVRHCHGRSGGVRMSFDRAAWLLEIRGGKVASLRSFADRGEAVAAAGLAG